MNDAEFEQQQARVQALMEKWKEILPVSTWLIRPRYHRDGVDKKGHKSDAVATTEPNWAYLHAGIDWNMPEVEDASDDDLENYVIHEYVHILIDELTRYALRREGYDGLTADWAQVEHVTSMLTLGIRWAYNAGKEEGIASLRQKRDAEQASEVDVSGNRIQCADVATGHSRPLPDRSLQGSSVDRARDDGDACEQGRHAYVAGG